MGKSIKYDVPFAPNDNNRCAVAVNEMILGYFEPDEKYSQEELDEFTGYAQGLGAWGIESALRFADRGYDLRWIEEFDFQKFADDAIGYLRELFNDEEKLAYQLKHSDIPTEQMRANTYLERGLHFENRKGTLADVRMLLDDGFLVRLEVNGNPLIGRNGYEGHTVLAVGYDEHTIIVHNASYESLPFQKVPDNLLLQAWKDFGGSFALQAFKK